MVLLEALHLGVPVVARSVGGIGAVIENQVSGILVGSGESEAIAEACLSILADDERRRLLASAGARLVAREFLAERSAAEVAMLYRSLCGS